LGGRNRREGFVRGESPVIKSCMLGSTEPEGFRSDDYYERGMENLS